MIKRHKVVMNVTLSDKYFPVDIIFLDFAKAFDMVWNRQLHIMLEAIGFNTEIIDWVMLFFRNRKQAVKMFGDNGPSFLSDVVESYYLVTDLIDKGSPVHIALFDLEKAFDRVCHRRLIVQLHAAEINNQVVGLIKVFLAQRTQQSRVEWCNVLSLPLSSSIFY
ncbi:hypothetical protein QYM36_006861 [Artemia franciscana]|uniref:Reverse transcriptase domain-containing protein n=1 Tax=Artemia franciscana TaxID=6661 RepID=A0AA88HUJ5_ARTSF|nr:hypothetical protein QYM36_006861 [Artemia franciscana]